MALRLTDKPELTRRLFFQSGLASASGYWLAPMLAPRNVKAESKVALRGAADACIFIFLRGGASHLDTFDLKEGKWTPPDFDVRKVKGGLTMPYGLFPRISEQLDDLVIARSVEAWDAAHPRAVYYMQVGHSFSPAREKDLPSVGAVVAHEFFKKRKPTDFLPPFVAMNFEPGFLVKNGCLPQNASPLAIASGRDLPFILKEKETFERRWKMLRELCDGQPGEASRVAEEWASYYESAFRVMSSPATADILKVDPEDHKRYGASALGDGCIVARNLLRANAGTRYVAISHNGWDLHSNIYDRTAKNNHYTLCKDLDTALPTLINDLKQFRRDDGTSLFDRTFIVSTGEFGRTGGDLTVNKGRDHNRMAQSVLFAGAGIKGGRAFGQTDENGVQVTKPEWNKKRSIYTEDIMATIYSQLGIDWTKTITNTPSGRAFEYLEVASGTGFIDIGDIPILFG